jgi:hypothetical protein
MPLDPSYFPKQQLPANDPRPILLQNGDLHQVLFAAPAHSKLLISASVVPIKNELRRLIWILAATGCGVVLLGLTGGWFFTKGAVRPIAKMTAAAETISATHLSERIDLNTVPGELAGSQCRLRSVGDCFCPAGAIHRRCFSRIADTVGGGAVAYAAGIIAGALRG